MKILMVTSADYPHLGGVSSHIQTLCNTLIENGEEVSIVSLSSVSKAWKRLLYTGPTLLVRSLSPSLAVMLSLKQRERLLVKALKNSQQRPDIINAQDVLAYRAARKVFPTVPVILTVHGYLAYEYTSDGLVVENSEQYHRLLAIESAVYREAAAIVTVDRRIADHVKALTGRSQGVQVIHNFVDTEKFKKDPSKRALVREKFRVNDRSVIICSRRLVAKNGVMTLAKALRHLKCPEQFVVIVAGDGPERQAIESELVKARAVEVHLLGGVPHAQISELYSGADIAVVPSVPSGGVEEATSISALEAMSSGLSVVASAIGGLREVIVSSSNGLLVPPGDPEELARALDSLVENCDLRNQLGKTARQYILDNHERTVVAKRYLQAYMEVLRH